MVEILHSGIEQSPRTNIYQSESSPQISLNGERLTARSASNGSEVRPWIVRFLSEANVADALVAIFTGLLFLVTRGLYKETARLAQGAEAQSKILVALESPVLAFYAPLIMQRRVGDAVVPVNELTTEPVHFALPIENVGRTNAHIRRIVLQTHFEPVDQERPLGGPIYRHRRFARRDHLQAPGGPRGAMPVPDLESEFSDSVVQAVRDGMLSLWVYGYIRYDNMAEETFDTGFLWRWVRRARGSSEGFFVAAVEPAEFVYLRRRVVAPERAENP